MKHNKIKRFFAVALSAIAVTAMIYVPASAANSTYNCPIPNKVATSKANNCLLMPYALKNSKDCYAQLNRAAKNNLKNLTNCKNNAAGGNITAAPNAAKFNLNGKEINCSGNIQEIIKKYKAGLDCKTPGAPVNNGGTKAPAEKPVETPSQKPEDTTPRYPVETPPQKQEDTTPRYPVETPPQKPVETPPASSVSAIEREVVALVNEIRASYGLSALSLNEELSKVARIKAEDMATNRYFSHTSPTYGSPFDMMRKFGISYRTAGENIAMGYPSAKAVVDAWMNSEGHRANILNASFTQIGVGYTANGNYWCQMFIG